MQSKPISFETFAPRDLERVDDKITSLTLATLWEQREHSGEIQPDKLRDAVGVYIIGSRKANDFVPWYVGKTDKGFKRRFNEHLRQGRTFQRIYEEVPTGNLLVIFIARTTSSKRLKLARKPGALTKTKAIKSVGFLESELIRSCHRKNRRLINTSNRVFHDGFSVPGFLGPRVGDQSDGAQALRTMLQ